MIRLKVGAAVRDPHSLERGWSYLMQITNCGSSTGPYPQNEVMVVPAPFKGFPCLYVWDVPVFPAM